MLSFLKIFFTIIDWHLSGNYILFRVTWEVNVLIWTRKGINYQAIFELSNVAPNTSKIINETTTLLVILILSVWIFLQSLTDESYLHSSFVAAASPVAMICIALAYFGYKRAIVGTEASNRGLMSAAVVWRCLAAPFYTITFRDNYTADVLTSFSKVIQDTLHGLCWITTGQVAHGLRAYDDIKYCESPGMNYFGNAVLCYLTLIRFMQCLRGCYTTGQFYPNGLNAIKYLSTLLVAVWGYTVNEIDSTLIAFIVFATLFRWVWDVVMDWGLWTWNVSDDAYQMNMAAPWGLPPARETASHHASTSSYTPRPSRSFSVAPLSRGPVLSYIMPRKWWKSFTNQTLLRPTLMFDSVLLYHTVIVLDLILRFFWIISLLPDRYLVNAVGPLYGIYLGSCEILRRAMWGVFRVEWEHVKNSKRDDKVGYDIPVTNKSTSGSMTSIDFDLGHGGSPSRDYVQSPINSTGMRTTSVGIRASNVRSTSDTVSAGIGDVEDSDRGSVVSVDM
jgi:hypothetical protein